MPIPTILSAFRLFRSGFRSATLTLALSVPLLAHAELSNESMIGAGVRLRPAYDGSDSQRGELVPVIRYFGQPWFARSTQGVLEAGARLQLTRELHAGAQVAYEPGRRTRESDFLENRSVFDIDRGASVGAHVEWDHKIGPVPIILLVRARQHADSDRGAQADFRLSVGVLRSGRLGAGVFAQTTWANTKATRSLYSVTPQQSAASGLPAYETGSGFLFTSVGLLWSVDLTPDWVMVGNFEARRLQSDARRSPLVERSTNYYGAAGVAYRF